MIKYKKRHLLALLLALLFGPSLPVAIAQHNSASGVVPLYKPADVVVGLVRHWAPPRAAALTDNVETLQQALQTLCDAKSTDHASQLADTRARWQQAVGAWERLSAVPFGPLIERRSARQVDFTPTRPKLIERAIKRAPAGAAAMELVGTPAKGFPALEWLLWTEPVKPADPACTYAVEVAGDILREAQALEDAFEQGASASWDGENAKPAFAEFINQWVGALEQLRWQQIERPVRERETGGRSAAMFPRIASADTAGSWGRQWAALRDLAVSNAADAPRPGHGVVSLERYLRGRGHNALADRWVQSIKHSEAAMHKLQPGSDDKLLAAARALASTKRIAEAEVAPALSVSIGFSDSDGD